MRASGGNAKFATGLGLIPASSDRVGSKGWHMKQCWITCIKRKKIPTKSAFKLNIPHGNRALFCNFHILIRCHEEICNCRKLISIFLQRRTKGSCFHFIFKYPGRRLKRYSPSPTPFRLPLPPKKKFYYFVFSSCSSVRTYLDGGMTFTKGHLWLAGHVDMLLKCMSMFSTFSKLQ